MVLENAKYGIQLAARIVDTPCNEMNTDAFLDEVKDLHYISRLLLHLYFKTGEYINFSNIIRPRIYFVRIVAYLAPSCRPDLLQIRDVGQQLGIVPTIIRDQELKERGFGGIFGVGQGALHPPALAVLSYTPHGATQNIAWVGKGIVYDTGGLSIKVIKCNFGIIFWKLYFIIQFTGF